MSIRQVKIGVWESSLTGQQYDSEIAARHYDQQEAKRSHPMTEGAKILESLTAAQIKSLHREMSVQADVDNSVANWADVQNDFLETCPEFLPHERNGSALAAVLVSRGILDARGIFYGTLNDVIDVYYELASQGVISLRPGTRLPKRESDADIEALSTDEILTRARGW